MLISVFTNTNISPACRSEKKKSQQPQYFLYYILHCTGKDSRKILSAAQSSSNSFLTLSVSFFLQVRIKRQFNSGTSEATARAVANKNSPKVAAQSSETVRVERKVIAL